MFSSKRNLLAWLCQIIVSGIFLQAAYFKFMGSSEYIRIFTTIGMESWGRYSVGGLEIFACALLLNRNLSRYGAVLSLGIIVPAIVAHVFKIGIFFLGSGGLFFGLAIIVLVLSSVILLVR